VIGPSDVLVITFWREKDLSAEVMVRPDGRISLPLLNDVVAAGLTPEELRLSLMKQAERFVEDTNVTVIVKAINSRWIYITGQVNKPGPYQLVGPTTVLQLIAMAGGLLEYADAKGVVVMRNENGKPSNFRFNYNDVVRQKNLKQNIPLKPGDTVVAVSVNRDAHHQFHARHVPRRGLRPPPRTDTPAAPVGGQHWPRSPPSEQASAMISLHRGG
jgi:polysaccharide export outer membrane protein